MVNGKGSKPRPKSVSYKTWDKNWQYIFGKKEKNSSGTVDKTIMDGRMKRSMREDQSSD